MSMAYDEARDRLVLFGGTNGPVVFNDTWEWDGSDWALRTPEQSPPPMTFHALAYDPARGRTNLFGEGPSSCETWEWDGAQWTRRSTLQTPSARGAAAYTFDRARGRLVIFGGSDQNRYFLDDTWEYVVPCEVIGPGHASGSLPIQWSAPPVLGGTMCVSFPSVRSVATLMLALAPARLPPLSLSVPGACAPLLLYPELAGAFVLPAAGNPAMRCLQVPAHPALADLPLTLQGLALQPGPCFRATDGIAARVQRN